MFLGRVEFGSVIFVVVVDIGPQDGDLGGLLEGGGGVEAIAVLTLSILWNFSLIHV